MRTKLTVLVMSLSAVMASSAFAGDIKPLHTAFNGSLGTGVKKDILRAVCPSPASAITAVEAAVGDKAPVNAPILKVQVKKVSANTNCTTAVTASGAIQQDNIDGDTILEEGVLVAKPSAFSNVAAGNGSAFRIEVFKTETGGAAESYSLKYHCLSANGTHNMPTLTYCQNQ